MKIIKNLRSISLTVFGLLLLSWVSRAAAIDQYEIQIYSGETTPPKHLTLELHSNSALSAVGHQQERHFIVPTINMDLLKQLEINLGVAIGTTKASNGVFLKSIIGWAF